jgi:ComF family protein
MHPAVSMLQAIGHLVFAPVCLACDTRVAPGITVCSVCRARIAPLPAPRCPRCGAPRLQTGRDDGRVCPDCAHWPPVLRFARSACALAPPADRLVYRLKYGGWHTLAGPLATYMAGASLPPEAAHEARVCVPVPTTSARRRERGYDQAVLLADAYAGRTGRRSMHALERSRGAPSQTTLQAAARGANVAGAFRADARVMARLRDAHVLLIDDVLTTGATAAACATALADAGARCVTLLTFARALDARRLTQPESSS